MSSKVDVCNEVSGASYTLHVLVRMNVHETVVHTSGSRTRPVPSREAGPIGAAEAQWYTTPW